MVKPNFIELPTRERIPILYEDRSVIAIDKPPGWMLVPVSWQKTNRNLHAALLSSIAAGHFWARSRNIKFLRNIHRLDAETSGVLMLAKSIGALETFSDMFETRRVEKVYLAVTTHKPKASTWKCRLSLAQDPKQIGRMVPSKAGKKAETEFKLIAEAEGTYLIEARPYTGRTHQIRVHLAETAGPVSGDHLYGGHRLKPAATMGRVASTGMALRAIALAYKDPFTSKSVRIHAPAEDFLNRYGFHDMGYQATFTGAT